MKCPLQWLGTRCDVNIWPEDLNTTTSLQMSDILPQVNGEYAQKEYWCALGYSLLPTVSLLLPQGATLPKVDVVKHEMRVELFSQHRRHRRDTSTFDWFKTYDEVSPILSELIPDQTSRVLILGCGNSTLSEDVSQTF